MAAVADAIEDSPALSPTGETRLRCVPRGDSLMQVFASSADRRPGVRIEVGLGDAVGYWHPGTRGPQALQPDYAAPTTTGLVESAPLGVLFNAAGKAILGWAAGESIADLTIRFGVSEEGKSFVVEVRPDHQLDHDLTVVIHQQPGGLAQVVSALSTWLSDTGSGDARTPSAIAQRPVYSTWYTFAQDIDRDRVIAEAALAVSLGLGSVFIDDGWQRFGRGRGYQGCGDWLPDTSKFPDLRGTIATIKSRGAGVALWIAPLLLGSESEAFRSWRAFAPARQDVLNCWVLDPRRTEVRDLVSATCLRLVRDFDVDLLKIDFLDQAMIYRDIPGNGDIDDVGRAMDSMLATVRRDLDAAGRADVAFEFRQPYVSPALARYGEILRANDCPADSVSNRASTLQARLISAGRIVHSDPLMWGTTGGAAAVAQQFYSAWYSVPQVSMNLGDLPADQVDALQGLLSLWRSLAPASLHGSLEVFGAERGYELAVATRPDLGQTVIARYAPIVVEIPATSTGEITVLNATADARLVVRTAVQLLSGVVRSAATEPVGTVAPTGPGLVELDVPAFGSVTISV